MLPSNFGWEKTEDASFGTTNAGKTQDSEGGKDNKEGGGSGLTAARASAAPASVLAGTGLDEHEGGHWIALASGGSQELVDKCGSREAPKSDSTTAAASQMASRDSRGDKGTVTDNLVPASDGRAAA